MIIQRYLNKQVLVTTSAITGILLVVQVFRSLIRLLGDAAVGMLDPAIVLLLIFFRLPEFVQLILPLALLIGILLAYGRMYAEYEMTILIACGMSTQRLLAMTSISTLIIAICSAFLSLWLTPWGEMKYEELKKERGELSEYDLIVPGVFQSIASNQSTIYVKNVSEESNEAENIFVSKNCVSDEFPARNCILLAESSSSRVDPISANRFILFENGVEYKGTPGFTDYIETEFESYGILLKKPVVVDRKPKEKTLSTLSLLDSNDLLSIAEFQWRISLVLIIPIVVLLAVPLSWVSPRKGRFARLLPGISLVIVYYGLLLTAKDMLEKAQVPALVGIWWVHLIFLSFGLYLLFNEGLRRKS